MQVKKALEALSKLDPKEEIFITWFDKKEFLNEFNEWTDEVIPEVTEEDWLGVVQGTENDDRIADAIMESMKFDFHALTVKLEQALITQLEQTLWKE